MVLYLEAKVCARACLCFRYGRPACEKMPWFTCVEGKGSSDQGLVYLKDAVQVPLSIVPSTPCLSASIHPAVLSLPGFIHHNSAQTHKDTCFLLRARALPSAQKAG